jgi:uncharacterized protein involved in type VI secretion and phage assembly
VQLPASHHRANSTGVIRGAVVGLVTNNKDPDNRGRIKVRFPWLGDDIESNWARVACFYAGPGRGGYIMPEVGDEVLLMFERGDPASPYMVGALWNGEDTPPGPGNPDGENNTKWFQSRSGHVYRFEDKDGAELIELRDCSGNLRFEIDVPKDLITIEAKTGDIWFKAPEGPINVTSKTMKITATNSTVVEVGELLNEMSKDRTESIGATDQATVKHLYEIGTKTMTVTNGTATIGAGSATLSVDKTTLQTMGSSSLEAPIVHRSTGPEVLTAGSLSIDASGRFEIKTSGPLSVIAGMASMTSKADAVFNSENLMTVMGGLISYNGGSNLTNQASLVTLC